MLFNSIEFLFFLPIVFLLYWFIFNKSLQLQNGLVLLASYFFYGWWSWKFLILLIISTGLDFAYGFGVASKNRRKAKFFLWLSIINNLGILGIFKYYNFFASQLQYSFDLLGIHTNPVFLNFALPIGISFYTFHGMSYVFDIYRGNQKPIRNLIDYSVFVSFFPLLVAGPIERATHLLPQVQSPRKFNYEQAVQGCRLILWGMLKKVIIADSLAEIVNVIYSDPTNYNGITLITAAVSFSFQIYCDFSGYSDIAIGVAKLFGFELLSNFKFPYFSRDTAEFWRRWHISLSSWFKDYLYIPLGGSKVGKLKAIRNTFIIFIVSGFWHGANWNFILWGFIHACGFLPLLLLNKNRKNTTSIVAENKMLPSFKEILQIVTTFTIVTIAWIFFRTENLSQSILILKTIGNSIISNPKQLLELPTGKLCLLYILPLILFDWYFRHNERILKVPQYKALRIAIYLISIVLVLSSINGKQSFIYFQF